MIKNLKHIIVFGLDNQKFALEFQDVDKIIQAVEVTPLPKAPRIVQGLINIHGQIMPVINIRKKFFLPEREIDIQDHFILARTHKRKVALAVDIVYGVAEKLSEEMVNCESILGGLEYVAEVVKFEEGILYIPDLDHFLSLEEEKILEQVIEDKG